MSERYPPEDPREWMNRARSNLALARAEGPGIYLEDLCFNAQQAAEKAIKALLIKHGVEFHYVHVLTELLTSLEGAGQQIPESVRRAGNLTRFAVFTRYPGIAPSIRREEYEEALALFASLTDAFGLRAEEIIRWVEEQL
ncbi:HEPN domain-containing protein [Candidatus Poribacteria bacterium]|nr:HEPN domain-containing protein [Candidatus Poribacteria bacterium]